MSGHSLRYWGLLRGAVGINCFPQRILQWKAAPLTYSVTVQWRLIYVIIRELETLFLSGERFLQARRPHQQRGFLLPVRIIRPWASGISP